MTSSLSHSIAATAQWTDVFVILRECGERTADAVWSSLPPGIEATRITGVPFSKTLAECYERSAAQQRPFVLYLDADVLPNWSAMRIFVSVIQTTPERYVVCKPLVRDKFFGITRPAGVHLYRTEFMPKLSTALESCGDSVRPETDSINALANQGHAWWQSDVVVGWHDYGQYFADIYRKCHLQAFKHRDFLDVPQALWRELADDDPDFRVALRAVEDACATANDTVTVSRNAFSRDHLARVLVELGLDEKAPLPAQPGGSAGQPEPTAFVDVPHGEDQLRSQLSAPLRQRLTAFEAEMHARFFSVNRAPRKERSGVLRWLQETERAFRRWRKRRW